MARLRSMSSLPADLDLAVMGLRSESRLITRWQPRSLGQLRDAEQDLVVKRGTDNMGRAFKTRSIVTASSTQRLS